MTKSNLDAMIGKLLDMDIVTEDDTVVFTEEAKQLIHEISKECEKLSAVAKNKDKAEKYGKGYSAEDVFRDMLYKIYYAPTVIHMRMVPRLLIPVIDQKLRARYDK